MSGLASLKLEIPTYFLIESQVTDIHFVCFSQNLFLDDDVYYETPAVFHHFFERHFLGLFSADVAHSMTCLLFTSSCQFPLGSHIVYLLKVSKFRKQIILSSHSPKNQRNFSHFLPWLLKSPEKSFKQKMKAQKY